MNVMPRTICDNMSQLTLPINFRFYFEGMEEIGSIAWKGSSPGRQRAWFQGVSSVCIVSKRIQVSFLVDALEEGVQSDNTWALADASEACSEIIDWRWTGIVSWTKIATLL